MDTRTPERIKHHFEIEKEIAGRLKKANREERKVLYRTMYDELFEKVPDHPRITRRTNPVRTAKVNKDKFQFIEKFIHPEKVFAEFAPGDCLFSFQMASHFKKVYGIDISDQTGNEATRPDNFELLIYDGYEINCPDEIVDILFSDQLIEHIPADETLLHFQICFNLLNTHGTYIFRIPHRYSGPHDVSQFFTETPQGFHLNEPTYTEIIQILKETPFTNYRCYYFAKGIKLRLPDFYFTSAEAVLNLLPYKIRKKLARLFVPRILMEVEK